MQQKVDEMKVESKDDDDVSFELTPENIAIERLRQVERELSQEHHQEGQHRQSTLPNNILVPQTCMEKDSKKTVELNMKRYGTKTLTKNMGKSSTMHGTDAIFESDEDSNSSFELTPENIANERLKQIEREVSAQDSNVSIKHVRCSPLTQIFLERDAGKEEINEDYEFDDQKPSCLVHMSTGTHISSTYEITGEVDCEADSVIAVNQTPGAFPIRGMSLVGDDDVDDSTSYSQPFSSSNELFVEHVDDEELAARYCLRAKKVIWDRVRAEATRATELSPGDEDEEAGNMTYRKRLTSVLVAISTLALALGLWFFYRGKKSATTIIPSSPPSFEPSSSDLRSLQDLFWSISGDPVFESSSAQYMALKWLVYEDPFFVEMNNEEIPSLRVRYALSVLYFSTNGSNWVNSTQFLTNVSVCDWQFIDCNVLESVAGIHIANNNLNGKIPSELAVISSLEEIEFQHNFLSGTIPDAIGKLSRLQYFDVGENYLTGSIPDSFSQLFKLEVLSLSLNMLTGRIPRILAKITALEIIDSTDNFLSGSIPNFAQKELGLLFLSNNLLDGSIPSSIMTLKSLKYLSLFNNMFTGTIPSDIKGIEKLFIAYLDGNDLSGIIPTTIGELEYLQDIWFSDNSFNGTIPSEFGQLTKLFGIQLDDNQLTGEIPSDIGLLSDLKRFAIRGNSITGTVPMSFSKLMNLGSVQISNTSISGSLDDVFCYPYINNTILDLAADCGGSFPEVNCTCCNKCCDDDSDVCEISSSQLCQNHIDVLESWSNMAVCNCDESYSRMSCNYLDDCQFCNEDWTICGTSSDFGWRYNYSTFTNTFTYRKGRNDTILWQESQDESGFVCSINVNGEECDTCTNSVCDDGYIGLYIDCTNVNVNSGLYNSCSRYEDGGIFDVFSWIDFQSGTGCPFLIFSFQL